MAAIITLVAARVGVAAIGAGALDIAVGQKTAVGRAVGRLHGIFEDIALFVERQEKVLRDAIVVLCAGFGIQVPGNTESLPDLKNLAMVARDKLTRRNTFAVCINQNGGTVFITP